MFIAEWCTPLGTEPFAWQKRRMDDLLSSVPPFTGNEKQRRRTPRKKERSILRSPAPYRKAAGTAIG